MYHSKSFALRWSLNTKLNVPICLLFWIVFGEKIETVPGGSDVAQCDNIKGKSSSKSSR